MAPLAVFIVFFGPSPPWMPLTLHSMSLNAQVKFVVIGDAAAPDVVPPNVVFEHISYAAMQVRLSQLLLPGSTSSVRYNWTYKANDIKPFAPALYPQHVAGYEWWAWADLDMVFGDLLRFMAHAVTRPACCKVPIRADGQPQSANKVNVYQHKEACPCDPGAQVNVISPLYPNPWRKKVWGPFTAFRTGLGTELFRESPHWRGILATNEYAHFDEWWGPFHELGWETMGDVVTRLAEANGTAILSKVKLPYAEAKSCRDTACMFCPCGAMRLRLRPGQLAVNERDVMLLHLAESKLAWLHSPSVAQLPAWAPPEPSSAPMSSPWSGCVQADNLGWMNRTCGATCTARAPVWDPTGQAGQLQHATRLSRHRVFSRWAGHIKYAARADEAASHAVQVGACPPLELERAHRSLARIEGTSMRRGSTGGGGNV